MGNLGKLLGYCARLSLRGSAKACFVVVSAIAVITAFCQDPCEGCMIRGHTAFSEQYWCLSEIYTCTNNQCFLNDWCLVPPISVGIYTSIRNIAGDPGCRCSFIRCGLIWEGNYTVSGLGGLVPPCTKLYFIINFHGESTIDTMSLVCFDENGNPYERLLVYEITKCPVSHEVVRLTQPIENCCIFEPIPLPVDL